MKWGTRLAVWIALGVLLIVIPPFTYEKLAQYYYTLHSHLFATYSGTRYYFDVAYLSIASGVVGYRSKNFALAAVVCLIGVFALIVLFYAICEPVLCYSTGPDGLQPLRTGSFFATEAVAVAFLGGIRNAKSKYGPLEFFGLGCALYAVAYNAVVFTLAGAKVLSPYDPYAALSLILAMSLAVTTSLVNNGASIKAALVPVLAQTMLLAVGIGITSQYSWEVVPFEASCLIASAIGSLLAVALARRRVGSGLFRGLRFVFAAVVIFVIVTTLVVWPDAVAGQVVSYSSPARPSSYSYVIPLYAGGFMSSPMIRPTAVATNVTLPDQDVNSLGPGNFLAAGIGVHSADCCTDGIDYGYRFDFLLWSNGSRDLTGSAWQICDANAACGGQSWKVLLYHFSTPYVGTYTGESLRLSISWVNDTVVWEYSSGPKSELLGSLQASNRMNTAFNAGWLGPPDTPSPGGAFFFQFGVTALQPLNPGWTATIACPEVFSNMTWSCVDHAETLQGDQSYWKVLWRWGENLPNVAVTADSLKRTLTLNYSTSSMESFVKLW